MVGLVGSDGFRRTCEGLKHHLRDDRLVAVAFQTDL